MMEQDPSPIDNLLRQRLYEASAPPPAFVWPRVEAALRKRRRRFLLFWLFGAGVLATGALGWWWTAGTGNSLQPISAVAALQTDQTTEKPVAATTPAPAETQRVQPGDNNSDPKTASETISNDASATHPLPTAKDSKSGKSASITYKSPQPETVQPATIAALPVAPDASALRTERTSETDLTNVTTHPVESAVRIQQLQSLYVPLLPLTHRTAHFSPLSAEVKPQIIRKNKKETRNCYDFSQHPNVFLLDAYLGPSLARKEMRTGPDNQPYLAQRRNTERQDWAFSAGVRASLLLDRHFLLRTGVHYDQINEVFEYIDPNSVEVTIRQTTQIINGQPVTVIDTLGVEYGEHYLKAYNRFGLLDIPLQAGMELRNGRTGLSLNGGIALNVLFWKRGAILSPVDGRPAYFTPEKGTVDVFRTKAGVSAMGSIQWFCHLRPRVRVYAEPYVRMVLRPVNIAAHPVEQRYGILGLNVGMTRILD